MRHNRLLSKIADLHRQAEHSMGLSVDEFDSTLPLEVVDISHYLEQLVRMELVVAPAIAPK